MMYIMFWSALTMWWYETILGYATYFSTSQEFIAKEVKWEYNKNHSDKCVLVNINGRHLVLIKDFSQYKKPLFKKLFS